MTKVVDPQDVRDATLDGLRRIYLIIVGLGITQALTRTFLSGNAFIALDLLQPNHLASFLLLIAYLVTAIRFAHGSILHLSAWAHEVKWLWDMFGLLLQAVLMFILSLTTAKTQQFNYFLLSVLAVDSFWLLVASHRGHRFSSMEWQWLKSNLILVILFALLAVLLFKGYLGNLPVWAPAAIIAFCAVAAALIDYHVNKNGYFPQEGASPMSNHSIYLAGPLFTTGERDFNLKLAEALSSKLPHWQMILPQVRAEPLLPDLNAVVKDCFEQVSEAGLVIACLDGPDSDSGTCVEVGFALAKGKRVIGYRTDFRGSEADGVNAMLRFGCDDYVLLPAYANGVAQLADALAERILKLVGADIS
jgi:hypothetical protein